MYSIKFFSNQKELLQKININTNSEACICYVFYKYAQYLETKKSERYIEFAYKDDFLTFLYGFEDHPVIQKYISFGGPFSIHKLQAFVLGTTVAPTKLRLSTDLDKHLFLKLDLEIFYTLAKEQYVTNIFRFLKILETILFNDDGTLLSADVTYILTAILGNENIAKVDFNQLPKD